MTPAERMRRHRARKREGAPAPTTRKQIARAVGKSERWVSLLGVYARRRAFEWDADILDGKHGRCGMSFIADVCRYAAPDFQRVIHDDIKANGAASGRRHWRAVKKALAKRTPR